MWVDVHRVKCSVSNWGPVTGDAFLGDALVMRRVVM